MINLLPLRLAEDVSFLFECFVKCPSVGIASFANNFKMFTMRNKSMVFDLAILTWSCCSWFRVFKALNGSMKGDILLGLKRKIVKRWCLFPCEFTAVTMRRLCHNCKFAIL